MITLENSIIQKRLTYQQLNFLEQIQESIGLNLNFYGSICRDDFFKGKSDIDIDILSPNVQSTLFKLRQILSIPNNEVIHVTWSCTNPIKYKFECIKIKYKSQAINLEISIYNIKYKDSLEKVRRSKDSALSPLLIQLLIVVKFFYYRLNVLDTSQLRIIKRFIMNTLGGHHDQYFAEKIQ